MQGYCAGVRCLRPTLQQKSQGRAGGGLTLWGMSRLFSTSANWPVMMVVLTSPCTRKRVSGWCRCTVASCRMPAVLTICTSPPKFQARQSAEIGFGASVWRC